jgi:hypothetical protein
MSLALKWGGVGSTAKSSGFIYFDAVTSKSVSYKGSVTSHPLSSGSLISDHFIRDNTVVTFSGIISGVDISYKSINLPQSEDGRFPTNIRNSVPAVKIENDFKPLYQRIPLVGQFFNPTMPKITMAVQPDDIVESVRKQLESLFLDGNVQLVSLYEYENQSLKSSPMTNLVMTSFSFQDDPDMTNVLRCEISLEQVQFSKLKKVTVPSEYRKILLEKDKVAKENAIAAANENNKSAIPETPKKPESGNSSAYDESRTGTGVYYPKIKDSQRILETASSKQQSISELGGV